ncbi:MAG: CCA tRNA nucleotidyltransferase, partial [Marinosulfonomonas sp.]|nr:CCA tRNA nucleotidyltransferase [Marinosulfonomonas sp.]
MTQITADWISNPNTQKVCEMLTDAGFECFFVGGCVRNALLGAPVNDIDISTNALPDRVMELAKAAGLKAVPTGIDHGTVTVIADGTPFEITTYRRDVETDGRRAVVAFSDTIMDDAHRRDFTMNALYADADGVIIDPLNGMPDLLARRIRFIEDADLRIKEDYLRILRFFRFHAW